MMKKRISILTLALLFFVSTTGLPLIVHHCEMMESVSLEGCEMHKIKIPKTSCCEEENDSDTYFSKAYDQCCLVKIVDSSVKDNFIVFKNDLSKETQLPIISTTNICNFISLNSSKEFYTDTSPPLLSNNHIYLTNSTFLI